MKTADFLQRIKPRCAPVHLKLKPSPGIDLTGRPSIKLGESPNAAVACAWVLDEFQGSLSGNRSAPQEVV